MVRDFREQHPHEPFALSERRAEALCCQDRSMHINFVPFVFEQRQKISSKPSTSCLDYHKIILSCVAVLLLFSHQKDTSDKFIHNFERFFSQN